MWLYTHTHTHTHKDSSRIILKQNNLLLILIISVFTLVLTLGTTFSKAALQANGNTPAQKDLGTWMSSIRDMEATGGTLGLSETKNSDLTSTNSNNLDCHMEKNSEYGAMAILSASSYGKQTPIADGETTTGNKSGVVIKINKERVSAGTLSSISQYVNAAPRYKDIYSENQINKNGDALLETKGWHDSGVSIWFGGHIRYAGMVRSCAGSLFSYNGNGVANSSNNYYSGDGFWSLNHPSRACIVVGERTLI